MQVPEPNEYNPDTLIDEQVTHAVTAGASTFAELLSSLPGIYPSIVVAAVRRLNLKRIIWIPGLFQATPAYPQSSTQLREKTSGLHLPVPHPLDYEWRFSKETINYLLETCQKLTVEDDRIALLGAPSVFATGHEIAYPRHLILYDANPALTARFDGLSEVIPCNLLTDSLPDVQVAAVLIDPPWYKEHIYAFLWAASRICQIGGNILLSLPPIGTRPGIEKERDTLLDWARQLGLELAEVLLASLTYLSPPFETNSLRAECLIDVPSEWRHGDLFIFMVCHRHDTIRPIEMVREGQWDEVTLAGVRIRVLHSEEQTFRDPRLITIIPGDILPSVSRRDRRRALAAVWTSGNRIFGCDGKAILLHVLRALGANTSPESVVATFLRRNLSLDEKDLIIEASHQITELVNTEWAEYAGQSEAHMCLPENLAVRDK